MAFFFAMNNSPIGIFDSGVGGMSVWKVLKNTLPEESFVYYADSAHCPYGPRDRKDVISLSNTITQFLIKKTCKLIVVACNTATAAAIEDLRSSFSVPFIGMEPAIKPAALTTQTDVIGVLATEGTINGKLYKETSARHATEKKVIVKIGKGLVNLVEKGLHISDEGRKLISEYILPMVNQNADHIVLGCTHYPFYKSLIEEIIDEHVRILDPAYAIARQTSYILNKEGLSCVLGNRPDYSFFTNGDPIILENILELLSVNKYKLDIV